MEIYDILKTDFSVSTDLQELIDVINKLQQFYKKEISNINDKCKKEVAEKTIIPNDIETDFRNETDFHKLIDVINKFQQFCKKDITKRRIECKDENICQSPFDNLEEVFMDDWENDWFIYDDGTIESKTAANFSISKNELTKKNWISYVLSEKDFNETNEGERCFYFAYLEALKRNGIKKIEIYVNTEDIEFS